MTTWLRITTHAYVPWRGIVTTSRAIPFGRTFRIPRPPALPNRVLEASWHSVGPAPHSVRTSRANRRLGFSASSFGDSPRADAKNIRARRLPFSGAETSDPVCPAGSADGGESGSPTNAPPGAQHAPGSCPSRGFDASVPTAHRQSAHRRNVDPGSLEGALRRMPQSVAAFHATSSFSQG